MSTNVCAGYGGLLTSIFLGFVGVTCFYASLEGQFVFDDAEAIINNKDLKPSTPLVDLLRHDFWGTDLHHTSSHKSYRPLTALSFRLHVWWHNGELRSYDFHLLNLILHGMTSALVYPVYQKLFTPDKCERKVFVASLLFAVHPVHTETVAGIVGRADLLCSLFSFLSLLVYCIAAESLSVSKNIIFTLLSGMLIGIAMLCKEQGITALGICSALDIVMVNQIHPLEVFHYFNSFKTNFFKSVFWRKSSLHKLNLQSMRTFLLLVRHAILLIVGVILILFRCWVMNFTQPNFRPIDNPHSFAESSVERFLNYSYIYAMNIWLLICPEWLCFDWSMGCIPLITWSNLFKDWRMLIVTLFWVILSLLIAKTMKHFHRSNRREMLLAILFIVVPFSVASNLLFRVGFVIAERILYLPSVGYCMLLAIGIDKLHSHVKYPNAINFLVGFLVLINGIRCNQRSLDWRTEKELFTKGLLVCPLNAKIHYNYAKTVGNDSISIKHYRIALQLYPEYEQAMNNLANVLRDSGNITESELLLRKALVIRPNFAAAWMNLGIVLTAMKRYDEALECYNKALEYRKNYPDCYYNLGNLFLTQKKYQDAFLAWKQATHQRPTHSIAWNNMIVMVDSLGELDQAQSLATEALTILPEDSSLHFNLANTLGKKGHYENAEQHFLKAIQLKENQALYHTNLGVLYHRWKKYDKAEKEYKKALSLSPHLDNVKKNLITVQQFLRQ